MRKQDPKVLREKSYFPYSPLLGARKEKARLFSMSQASVFSDERIATKSANFNVWSVFSKAGVPVLPPLTGLWLIWPRLPWVPSVRTQAGKTGRDIKETRVWKRKTRMRCRGNMLVNTGCSYRGPFQVDQRVYLLQTYVVPIVGSSATHLDAQDR